ncbi:hypothetical protein [Thermomonospora echinospora]|nr:hypothetical protein [Thermomonospora echinospora]
MIEMAVLVIVLAVFLAGAVVGAFTFVVVGIHAEERRAFRDGATDSRCGAVSRRLLTAGVVREGTRR